MFPFKSVNSDRMLSTLTNIIHDNNYPTYKLVSQLVLLWIEFLVESVLFLNYWTWYKSKKKIKTNVTIYIIMNKNSIALKWILTNVVHNQELSPNLCNYALMHSEIVNDIFSSWYVVVSNLQTFHSVRCPEILRRKICRL